MLQCHPVSMRDNVVYWKTNRKIINDLQCIYVFVRNVFAVQSIQSAYGKHGAHCNILQYVAVSLNIYVFLRTVFAVQSCSTRPYVLTRHT